MGRPASHLSTIDSRSRDVYDFVAGKSGTCLSGCARLSLLTRDTLYVLTFHGSCYGRLDTPNLNPITAANVPFCPALFADRSLIRGGGILVVGSSGDGDQQ